MIIDALSIPDGPNIYYETSFRNVLEDHMTLLRNHPATTTITVEPLKAYKYEFDLFGLLSTYNVPVHLRWLVMRLNNMVVPTDATRDIEILLVPDLTVVDRIRQSHITARRVT